MERLDLISFRRIYGFNKRRNDLIDVLTDELTAVVAKDWEYKAYIFGSFIKKPLKPNPGDIDVLLSLSRPYGAEPWYQLGPISEIHITHCIITSTKSCPSKLLPGKSVIEMIEIFNDNCRRCGEDVRIEGDGSNLVEVI